MEPIEMKEFRKFSDMWGVIVLLLIALGLFFASCNTSKHIVKSETQIDTSRVTKTVTETKTKIDSSSYITSNLDFTDSSVIQTTDEYKETIKNTYKQDTATKKDLLITSETTKTGTRKTTENKNTKTKKLDTSYKEASTEIKAKEKKDINQAGKSENKQSEKQKESKSAIKVPSLITWGFILFGIIMSILVIKYGYRAYKADKKVK